MENFSQNFLALRRRPTMLSHFRIALALFAALRIDAAFCAQAPARALDRLSAGQPVELIVEYEAATIEQEAAAMRQQNKRHVDDDSVLAFKAGRYKTLKDEVDRAVARPDNELVTDYSHLPMSFRRFRSLAALNALLARPEVKDVYWNDALHAVLAQSLPLINQPAVAGAGYTGSGSTVAVIDDGIDYARAAFGSCTAPGTPAGCHVIVDMDFGSGTTDTSHGTNVSAIVLGVASAAQIAMLNAFSGTSALTSDIISAINWAVAHRTAYNIVAINMSLGDGGKNTQTCQGGNAFYTPVTSAINAGISVVAAAGNDAYTNALNKPACTPGVISVGAVYDSDLSNQGYPNGVTWGSLCTDSTTAADKIVCFSDTASFLTMLAPGAMITAAGITDGGTSQASPHVAGAVAVLRAAFPQDPLGQTLARLTGSGVMITDTRNGINITKPRLNLLAAAAPANDEFSNRIALGGNNGSVNGVSLLATKESGEPAHAGNPGGHSIWWKYAATATGQLSLNTHGSSFDTLLAAYTGSSVSALTAIASNDNDGSANGTSGMFLQVHAGTEYEIAADGANGTAGTTTLNWSLNTSATADLSVAITGPSTGASGTASTYMVAVTNAGPQTATNVVSTITLPANSSFSSGPSACSAAGTTVTCGAGSLGSGALISLPIQLIWNTPDAAAVISTAVASDVPDPSLPDNASSIQVMVGAGSNPANDNDVPTLPQWGMIMLALLLTVAATRAQREM